MSGKDKDDRLPLRWGVIILGALGAAIIVGYLAGVLAGWTMGVATTALLHKILANS